MSDREALDLLFVQGFQPGAPIADGPRAEGMHLVKSNIERIGGVVDVSSTPGHGTAVRIKIPLTLAIIPGLVVTAGSDRFVIPQVSLRELIRLEGDGLRQMETVEGTSVLRRRGSLLPIVRLRALLGVGGVGEREGLVNVVVLQADGHEFGLVVDNVQDAQEIVVKPLDKQLKGLNVYAGATIMGDGRVALILDVHGIAELSSVFAEKNRQARAGDERRETAGVSTTQNYLVFKAGSFERLAVPLSLVARLEEFPRDRVERAGGELVVQYRGRLLHLVPLRFVLDGEPLDAAALPDPVQAVVFSDGDRSIGLIVDRIVDILDDSLSVRQPSSRPGLCGSAVVGKKVTDFLDLDAVLGGFHTGSESAGDASPRGPVVLADGSAFTRALLKNTLELAGISVIEAASTADALAACDRNQVHAVLAAHDLPGGCGSLARQVRSRERLSGTRVLGLTTRPADRPNGDDASAFDGWVLRTDREGLLASVTGAATSGPAIVEERS